MVWSDGAKISEEWMALRALIDSSTMPMQRFLANLTAPSPSKLCHPLFSERIRDRRRRWHNEQQPNPYAAIDAKPGGQAFMRSLGHAVPEVYGVYPSLDAIPDFADLPSAFVLKPAQATNSIGVFLMRNGIDLASRRRLTRDEIIATVRSPSGKARKFADGNWMAEELLFDFSDTTAPARDHKFFCFGPRIATIQINRRTGMEKPPRLYWFRDADWKPLPFRLNWSKYQERTDIPRPPQFDDMLSIVSDVGARLNIFLRIDMYATTRGPVFGEFTAYPHNGLDYTPRGDAWLGSLWTTPDGGAPSSH